MRDRLRHLAVHGPGLRGAARGRRPRPRPTRSRPPRCRCARYDVVVALSRSGTTTEVAHALMRSAPLAHGGGHRRPRLARRRRGRRGRRARVRRRALGRADALRHHRAQRCCALTRASTSRQSPRDAATRARRAAPGRARRGRPLGVPRPRLDHRPGQRGGAEAARVARRRGPRPTRCSSTATGRSASPGRARAVWFLGAARTTACSRTPARRARLAVAPDLDPLASLVLAQRTAVALAEAARPRSRPPAQPDAFGRPCHEECRSEAFTRPARRRWRPSSSLAGCGGGGGTDNQARRAGGDHDVARPERQSAGKVLSQLAAEFNRTHPNIHVNATTGGVVADSAAARRSPPRSPAATTPTSPTSSAPTWPTSPAARQVLDLTDDVKQPGSELGRLLRAGPRRDHRRRARARAAGAASTRWPSSTTRSSSRRPGVTGRPQAGWTWDDFAATAKQLTDTGKGAFGTGWPAIGDEDTVWRIWPMVWHAGGDVVTPDGKAVGFGGAARRAGARHRAPARAGQARSTSTRSPTATRSTSCSTTARWRWSSTGPWQLPDFIDAKVDYGVAPLPTFGGEPLTISAPDTWTLFDNGKARAETPRSSSCTWLNAARAGRAVGTSRRGSCRCARARREQPEWTGTTPRTCPACRHVRRRRWTARARSRPIPSYPKISEARRAVARRGAAQAHRSPEDALRQAVAGGNKARLGAVSTVFARVRPCAVAGSRAPARVRRDADRLAVRRRRRS